MDATHTVLLVGGTGRTGGRVLAQLLARGVAVRAVVRSSARLPAGVTGNPRLSVVDANVHAMTTGDWQRHLEGCDTVISCLGHTISVRGVLGPPFDLVTRTVSNLVDAVRATPSATPVRVILMGSVSVREPGSPEPARDLAQRLLLFVLRVFLPPAHDNQRAAEVLARTADATASGLEWVVVRPDTLRDGDVTEYRLHEQPVSNIFRPDETNMANVAHFMCELTCDPAAWRRWRGHMPVIVNATPDRTT